MKITRIYKPKDKPLNYYMYETKREPLLLGFLELVLTTKDGVHTVNRALEKCENYDTNLVEKSLALAVLSGYATIHNKEVYVCGYPIFK